MAAGSGRAAAPRRRRCSRGSWARGGSFVGPLPRRPPPADRPCCFLRGSCARATRLRSTLPTPPRPAPGPTRVRPRPPGRASRGSRALSRSLALLLSGSAPPRPAGQAPAPGWRRRRRRRLGGSRLCRRGPRRSRLIPPKPLPGNEGGGGGAAPQGLAPL